MRFGQLVYFQNYPAFMEVERLNFRCLRMKGEIMVPKDLDDRAFFLEDLDNKGNGRKNSN
jgi:hypothetical protein